jgi:hypothetical protein
MSSIPAPAGRPIGLPEGLFKKGAHIVDPGGL